jgi:hypothetical protein
MIRRLLNYIKILFIQTINIVIIHYLDIIMTNEIYEVYLLNNL